MKPGFALVALVVFVAAGDAHSQHCCVPSVPQQGVLGETAALPHTLELGLHFQYLRSLGMYNGSTAIDDPDNRKTEWTQATFAAAYGILAGLSVGAVVPYTWKRTSECLAATGTCSKSSSDGIGDVAFIVRYSPVVRSYVSFRELSIGLGVKFPTGSTSRFNDWNVRLSEELQPGTGSWDFHGSVSFYQGHELVDFVVSGVYVFTTEHEWREFGTNMSYESGDQFSYLFASDFHVSDRLDITAALSGIVRGKDRERGVEVSSTGRHQLWVVPGFKIELVPEVIGLQAYFEYPIYQHFNGRQLGSDYNIRLSAAYSLPLGKSDEGGA